MFSKLIVAGLLTLTTVSAFATTVKNARSNDVASKYILDDSGKLSRIMKGSGLKCDITTKVANFTVSAHKNDVAMIYFKKNGNLHILTNARGDLSQCPKANQGLLVAGIKKYTVVSNTSSESLVVNMTLDNGGNFKAWDNTHSLFTVKGVREYVNNSCFGQRGASFSSFTAFALKFDGSVVKIKGGLVEAKADNNYYASLQDFKASNRVCESQR